jgi:predicted ATPase
MRMKRGEASEEGYPFAIPIVRTLDEVVLRSPVTFFVGKNGSGKSTILEAIAAGVGSISVGGEDVRPDPTLAQARRLAAKLVLG